MPRVASDRLSQESGLFGTRNHCATRTVQNPQKYLSVAVNTLPNLSVTCEVLGLGPAFALRVAVTNAGTSSVFDAAVTFETGTIGAYALPITLRLLPSLIPGATAIVDISCECADPMGAAGEILVHIITLPAAASCAAAFPLSRAPARPVASAVVHLPAVSV